jgi:hypothetical protein
MRLTRKKAGVVKSAIGAWIEGEMVSQDQGRKLLESVEVVRFDWKRVAKYSFWISIICIVISVAAIVTDDFIRELLAKLFNTPDILKCLFMAFMATLFYYLGIKRKGKHPARVFSNEAIFLLGVLATAASIGFLGKAIDTGSGHFSVLILLAAIIYGILGLWFPSKLVWIFALISMGGWLGAETGYASGWGVYWLGMNYPLRNDFFRPTLAIGLLYLFIALWIMSIFGNYGDMREWEKVRQISLFHWSFLFGLAAVASIFHGIKNDDGMTRGFGITFLFINLYTRFFEYFWDNIHKAVFFAILAVSFWLLGSRAEKIWNLGQSPKQDQPDD